MQVNVVICEPKAKPLLVQLRNGDITRTLLVERCVARQKRLREKLLEKLQPIIQVD